MSIRNSAEIGENLFKITDLLLTNSRLLKLLRYTDKNPFNHEDVDISTVLHKNIRVVPLVNSQEDTTESTIVLIVNGGEVEDNSEFKNVSFDILVYTPFREWIVNDLNLRPFLIISEVEKSLKKKRIQGLGTIQYNGFGIHLITDIMGCYRMSFEIDVFN